MPPVQRLLRQLFPAAVTPALEAMRPYPPHDPSVESVEESSDVGSNGHTSLTTTNRS
jgi:hypothetical protein